MKNSYILGLLIAISLLLSVPFFRSGLPLTDDANSMVLRATAFHQSFLDGQLPVRWLARLHENYGYPVTNFLYPLPFYISEIFILIGFTPLNAVKLLFILTNVVSAVGIFFWLKTKTSRFSAFLASLLYIALPYRLIDLYVRGSLGEVVALAILPWIFYFYDSYLKTKLNAYLLLTSITLGSLILSHNSLALIFLPIIATYFLFQAHTQKSFTWKKAIIHSGIIVTVALLLTSFFWGPALLDLKFTRASQIQIADVTHYFPPLSILIKQLDPFSIFILLLSVIIFPSPLTIALLVFTAISLLLQSSASLWIWQHGLLNHLVQFPFRFLAIPVLVTAFNFALIHQKIKWPAVKYLLAFLVLLLVVKNIIEVNKYSSQPITQSYFDTNFDTTTTQKEYTPIWVKEEPKTAALTPVEILGNPEKYTIVELQHQTNQTFLQLRLDEPAKVTFNFHYFPGWTIFLDDRPITPNIKADGRPELSLPSPDRRDKMYTIKVVWSETPTRQIFDFISLSTGAAITFWLIYLLTRRKLITSVAIFSSLILFGTFGLSLIYHLGNLKEIYQPEVMHQRYLDSQWVNPDSKHPIGDHGLYSYAGWEYIHGKNPILINPEMPPLGKYLIGLGLVLFGRPAIVGVLFSFFFLVSVYLLSAQILQSRQLAILPTTLIFLEPIFRDSFYTTMLDPLQVGFLALTFLFLIKAEKKTSWMIPAALALGGVLTTKFYATGFLVILSVVIFYLISSRFKLLLRFLVFLPLTFLVHLLSYAKFFQSTPSLIKYLGVQKYIYVFYKTGQPHVPLGSYWLLILLNRWRVWWGDSWGSFFTLNVTEWRISWPINFVVVIIYTIKLFKNRLLSKKVYIESYHLVTVWLLIYSLFLATIAGWPHYLLLFLPFSNILLVKLIFNPYLKKTKIIKLFLSPIHKSYLKSQAFYHAYFQ